MAPVAGKTSREATQGKLLSDEILVVAIEREGQDQPITPRGNTEIKAGDLLTVYSTRDADPEVTDIFGHYEDQVE